MTAMRFPVEFDREVDELTDELKSEAAESLHELAKGHEDIVSASVAADEPARGETGYLYQVRIVLHMRPENLFASEKHDTLQGALKGALQAIERQVRESREMRGKPWQRPDRSSS